MTLSMDERKALADRVKTDLSTNEQETGLNFFGDADYYTIFSYKPTIVRSLLCHAEADIDWLYLMDASGREERVVDISAIEFSKDKRVIKGISVSLPLGTLSIKGTPRKNDYPSQIVTTPEEVEGVEAVFSNGGAPDG